MPILLTSAIGQLFYKTGFYLKELLFMINGIGFGIKKSFLSK